MRNQRNGVSIKTSLADLADVRMGYPFRSRLEPDPLGDVSVIQMKDIDDTNLLQLDTALRLSLPDLKGHHLLRPGDLLFRSRGRSNGAAEVRNGIGRAVLAGPMLRIRPRRVLPAYLCWYLNLPSTQAQLAALSEGTSVQMISAESLKSLPIPLPSAEVQTRIAKTAALVDQEQALLAQIAGLRRRLTTDLLLKAAQESTERPSR